MTGYDVRKFVELRDYWRLITRNLLVMALSLFLGIGAAAAITFTATPQYDASSQIFISTPAAALDISALATGSSFSQQRVKSYAQIINGPATLQPVIDSLKLKTTVDALAKRVSASAPLDTVLITLKVTDTSPARAAAIANAVAAQFAVTVGTLEISQTGGGSPVKVSTVKSATAPTAPSSPKKALNLALGLLLGFGLGLSIATLRQIFDNTVKNEEQLADNSLLAAIAFDNEAERKPLVTDIGRYASRAESFRQLRTNLQFIRAENPPKVIAVSSALPNEGKTSSAINLAITMTQAGFSVALIEADLRRPRLGKYLNYEKDREGLTDVLTGRVKIGDFESALIAWGEHGLRILPSGQIPPNPAELLNSETMTALISTLRQKFDYVVIDCPPLLPVTDAAVVASKADGVLLIIRTGSTKVTQFKGAVDSVTAVGSSVLGVVLNMIPRSRTSDEYGYRYGSSYYYGNKYGPQSGKYGPIDSYAPRND